MTVHVVLAEPPRAGLVLSDLADASPLSPGEAAELYAAMVKDVCRAVAGSGGDLLVNYPSDEQLPAEFQTSTRPLTELEELVQEALDDPEAVRFEVQVGSSFDARVGNTVTHLLREEEADSVALVDPRAPTVPRTGLDTAAMKLRRHTVVIGPAPVGRSYYLGVTEPIEFKGAFLPPEVVSLADRGVDTGGRVDYLPMQPVVESETDLVTLVALIEARQTAGLIIPTFTADIIDRFGLQVEVTDNGHREVRRDD